MTANTQPLLSSAWKCSQYYLSSKLCDRYVCSFVLYKTVEDCVRDGGKKEKKNKYIRTYGKSPVARSPRSASRNWPIMALLQPHYVYSRGIPKKKINGVACLLLEYACRNVDCAVWVYGTSIYHRRLPLPPRVQKQKRPHYEGARGGLAACITLSLVRPEDLMPYHIVYNRWARA